MKKTVKKDQQTSELKSTNIFIQNVLSSGSFDIDHSIIITAAAAVFSVLFLCQLFIVCARGCKCVP